MQLENVKDIHQSMTMNNIHFGRNKVCNTIKQSKKHQYSEILNENAKKSASVSKLLKEIGKCKRENSGYIFPLK